mmetsp:Transcript_21058/g.41976  ORF Transcript_21058/g.41976 Transcript_21058/m.41976 type:complete len:221 (-) Transcript_21058:218-880(-)
MDVDSHTSDDFGKHQPPLAVQLGGHQEGRHLKDVGLATEVGHCLGSLQTQQPASDDCRLLCTLVGKLDHCLHVLNSAVHEDSGSLGGQAGSWRHERKRPSGEDQIVVGHTAVDHLLLSVDLERFLSNEQGDVVLSKPAFVAQSQLVWVSVFEEGRHLHSVIRWSQFFAEDDQLKQFVPSLFNHRLKKIVSNGTVSKDNDLLPLGRHLSKSAEFACLCVPL